MEEYRLSLRFDVEGNANFNLYAAVCCRDLPRAQQAVTDGGRVTQLYRLPDTDLYDDRLFTVLEVAFHTGNREIVWHLLNQLTAADIAEYARQGISLICRAMRSCMPDIALFLINTNRFDLNLVDITGETPLGIAATMGGSTLVVVPAIMQRVPQQRFVLLQPRISCPSRSVLQYAVEHNNVETVKALLQYSGQRAEFVEMQDSQGRTALHLAAESISHDKFQIMSELQACSDRLSWILDGRGQAAADLFYDPATAYWDEDNSSNV